MYLALIRCRYLSILNNFKISKGISLYFFIYNDKYTILYIFKPTNCDLCHMFYRFLKKYLVKDENVHKISLYC